MFRDREYPVPLKITLIKMDHKNNRFIKIKKGIGKSFSIISDRRLKPPC